MVAPSGVHDVDELEAAVVAGARTNAGNGGNLVGRLEAIGAEVDLERSPSSYKETRNPF